MNEHWAYAALSKFTCSSLRLFVCLSLVVSNLACQDESSVDHRSGGEDQKNSGMADQKPNPDLSEEPVNPVEPASPSSDALRQAEIKKGYVNLLMPALAPSCGGCHGNGQEPQFLHSDQDQAFDSAVQAGLLKEILPAKFNRFYQRAAEDLHNCGGPDACAQLAIDIQAKLEEMGTQLQSLQEQPQVTADDLRSEAVALTKAVDVESIPLNDSIVLIEPEQGIVSGEPAIVASDKESQLTGIKVKDGKEVVGSVAFEVKIEGRYRPWVRYRLPAGSPGLSLRAGFTGQPVVSVSNLPVSETWTWGALSMGASIELGMGSKIFGYRIAGDLLIEIDKFVLSESTAGVVATKVQSIGFDLSKKIKSEVGTPLPKVEVFLEVDISEKSYLFKYPFMKTNVPVKVKNLKIEVNGRNNDRASSFTAVDKVVNPPGAYLIQATEVIAADKGRDEDQISLSFEVLEAATEP